MSMQRSMSPKQSGNLWKSMWSTRYQNWALKPPQAMICDAGNVEDDICARCPKKPWARKAWHYSTKKQYQHQSRWRRPNLQLYTPTVVLLLLRANHNDAIKLGDGERVIRLYKYFVVFQDFQMPKICLCNAASPSTSKLFADSEDELFSHLEQVREPPGCNWHKPRNGSRHWTWQQELQEWLSFL